jgi:hypothetical protein
MTTYLDSRAYEIDGEERPACVPDVIVLYP